MLAHTEMLRWSAETTRVPVDVRAVTDPSIDPLLPGGRELIGLVDASVDGGADDEGEAREAVRSVLGEPALVDAAAVIGNFQMMNRVADATGMPVGRGSRARSGALIEQLGLDRFDHSGGEPA